jgi:hypothetical protein
MRFESVEAEISAVNADQSVFKTANPLFVKGKLFVLKVVAEYKDVD